MTTNHIGWNEVALDLTSHTGPSSRTSYPGLRQKRDCPRRQQASWDVGQSRDPKVLRQRTWEWARWRPVCRQLFSNDFLTIQDLSFLLCELGTVVAARLIWRLRLDELVCIKHLQQCLHVMSTQKKKKKCQCYHRRYYYLCLLAPLRAQGKTELAFSLATFLL